MKIELKSHVEEMKEEIKNSSVQVEEDLSKHLSAADDDNMSSFMKLVWNELQSYLRFSEHCIHYHPMLMTFCFGLTAKSWSTRFLLFG